MLFGMAVHKNNGLSVCGFCHLILQLSTPGGKGHRRSPDVAVVCNDVPEDAPHINGSPDINRVTSGKAFTTVNLAGLITMANRWPLEIVCKRQTWTTYDFM